MRWARRSTRHQAQTDISRKAQSYGLASSAVDGMDVLAVEAAAKQAADFVRSGNGPFLLELRTYRFRAHSMSDPDLYRTKEEIEEWKKRDPIMLFEARLREWGLLTDSDLAQIESEISAEIDECCPVCRSEPSRTSRRPAQRRLCPGETMTKMTYREAVRAALRKALRGDPRVFLMGEDVGRYGGAFAVSLGLLGEFGPERIRDTPLSESAFVGAGIGAALGGMRPIVEIMTVNFSMLAMDQILNNAATLRHMSGGQFNVPLVVRVATGGGRQMAAQHSHSLEVLVRPYSRHQGLDARDRCRRLRNVAGSASRTRSCLHLRARNAVSVGRRNRRSCRSG